MAIRNVVSQLVVFRLEQVHYALALAAVARIVRAVAVTPLPKAPPIVLGVIDVEGRILLVLSLRRRFRLPEREIGPADQIIIAHAAQSTVFLPIDEAEGVIERPDSRHRPTERHRTGTRTPARHHPVRRRAGADPRSGTVSLSGRSARSTRH